MEQALSNGSIGSSLSKSKPSHSNKKRKSAKISKGFKNPTTLSIENLPIS